MPDSGLKNIHVLQPDVWENASVKERIEGLQKAENNMAAEQNRPSCVVVDFAGDPHSYGRFNPQQPDVIEINQDLIKSDNPVAAVETVAHEGRHAYQADCIRNPEAHPEAAGQLQDWQSNFDNYISASEDREGYENQPVEVDANNYASSVVSDLYPAQSVTESAEAKQQSAAPGQEQTPAEQPAPQTAEPAAKEEPSSFRDRMQAKQEAAEIKKVEPPPEPAHSQGLSR